LQAISSRGQPAANLHSSEPGLFFKTTDGSVVKFGPAAITSDGSPPNSSPQGASGNSVGELWLDKSVDPAVLKVYDGTAWVDAGSGGGGGGGTAAFLRWIYTAAGGETSLSGSSGGVLLDYTPGLEEVYVNGVLITRGTDYSATNGSSITNLSALTAGDVVTVMSMNPVDVVQLPGQVTLLRWTVLATSGQTVLSGVDSSGQQLAYTPGFEEVYINGAFLRREVDYIATNGSTITGLSPLTEDDEITVMAWSPFSIGSQIVNADVADNAGIDSAKLAFTRSGASTTRTVQQKLEDTVSILDFGPVGNGVANDTQPLVNALATGKDVYIPKWVSLRVTEVDVTSQRLYGGGTIRKNNGCAYALRLLGESPSVEGIRFKPYNQSGQPNADIKVGDGASQVVITQCFFDGRSSTGGNIYSAIASADNLTGDFPYSTNIIDLRITNNTFLGYVRPVYLFCLNFFNISNNHFQDSLFDAMRIREVIGEGVIDSNTFFNIGDPSWSENQQTRDCIDTAFSGRNLVISNNVMVKCAYKGLDIKGIGYPGDGSYSSRCITISGNFIQETRYSGISLDFGDNFQWGFNIIGNTVLSCLQNNASAGTGNDGAIILSNGVRYANVSDNLVIGNFGRGISITRDNPNRPPGRMMVVSGNICMNNSPIGIFIRQVTGAVVTNNICGNDTTAYTFDPSSQILPETNGQVQGFVFSSCTGVIFTGNTAVDNNSLPLVAEPSDFSVYANNSYIGTNADFSISTAYPRWALGGKKMMYGNGSAPIASTGEFNRGDIILRDQPSDGNPIGLVCTADGTPGTWVPFGTVGVGSARTGWQDPTGTASKASFDTSTVTVQQLAERVKAIIDELKLYGAFRD